MSKNKNSKILDFTAVFLMFFYLVALFSIPGVLILAYSKYYPGSAAALVLSICFLLFITPRIRFYKKRRKFVKRLEKTYGNSNCITYKWMCNKTKYSSSVSGTTDLIIESDRTEFHIMFLPCPSGRAEIQILKDGTGYKYIFPYFLGKLGQNLGVKRRTVKRNMSFVCEDESEKTIKRIVLLNPVPKALSIIAPNERDGTMTGPGERIKNFTLENTDSLFRCIERELDKSFY
ncbi:MAG: hypothetical protein MJ236_01785 [Clostridia bacterium]|nr:hypothetical protein [Clostridia bacterium]